MSIILSPEDEALLKMTPLEIAANTLRLGNAPEMAKVCEEAAAEIRQLRGMPTPSSLHEYSELSCVAFFYTTEERDAFMAAITKLDEARRP